jgi:uncharacterized protein YebE (UPF0316 family)
MVSGQTIDALAVVALVSFYGGISRELATTADFLDIRLGLGLSLGAYVATGVAALLSLAVVVTTALGRFHAGDSLAAVLAYAVGLAAAFLVAFAVFFKLGTATYGLLLRFGLDLT